MNFGSDKPLLVLRRERIRLFVQLFSVKGVVGDHHTVSEGRLLALLHLVVEGRLLRVEDAPPWWIRRKEVIAARMPVGRVPGVFWMVDDGDRIRVIAFVAGKPRLLRGAGSTSR